MSRKREEFLRQTRDFVYRTYFYAHESAEYIYVNSRTGYEVNNLGFMKESTRIDAKVSRSRSATSVRRGEAARISHDR